MNLSTLMIHRAWYWEPTGPDGAGGIEYATPVLISIRWKQEAERFTPTIGVREQDGLNEEIVSFAQVLCDVDLKVEGLLQFEPDKTATIAPANTNDALLIRRVGWSDSLDGRVHLCKAWLL